MYSICRSVMMLLLSRWGDRGDGERDEQWEDVVRIPQGHGPQHLTAQERPCQLGQYIAIFCMFDFWIVFVYWPLFRGICLLSINFLFSNH